jgi:ubiquitin-protein ligase
MNEAHEFGKADGIDDPVYERFLQSQLEEGMELARSSDLLTLHVPAFAPPHFVAEFRCRSLVRGNDGEIVEAEHFQVGVWFPADYLRRADPFEMLRLFTPGVWHPNVSADLPLICIGRMTPGMRLVDILYQVFEILTYHKFNPREDNALNKPACSWARANQERFPIDRRPLKRRAMNLEVKAL